MVATFRRTEPREASTGLSARRRAEEDLERARQEFYAEVMAARGAGASLSAMGRALGVSRQRMQKLVERIGRSG